MRRSGVRIPLPPQISRQRNSNIYPGDENLVRPAGREAQGLEQSSQTGAGAKRWINPFASTFSIFTRKHDTFSLVAYYGFATFSTIRRRDQTNQI
jgi:hypothetical protein